MIEKFFGDSLVISAEDIQSEYTLVPGDKLNLSIAPKGHFKVFIVRVSNPFENEERS